MGWGIYVHAAVGECGCVGWDVGVMGASGCWWSEDQQRWDGEFMYTPLLVDVGLWDGVWGLWGRAGVGGLKTNNGGGRLYVHAAVGVFHQQLCAALKYLR